ncbi:MAG: sterol desaturase, partial [Bacteroidota bacterium]
VLPYTDTNYGNILSIWDRLFGTFAKMRNEEIVYGVDTYPDASENAKIGKLLKIPFNTYKAPTEAKLKEN